MGIRSLLLRFVPVAMALAWPAGAALPTKVTLTPSFGTDAANKFRYPVWFGEVTGLPGVYAVLEQGNQNDKGRIWLLEKEGSGYAKKEFLAIDVLRGGDEPGLLGVAFHPRFAENRRYFIYYVAASGASVLEERAADASLRKDAGAAPKVLITYSRLRTNHNGGDMAFGKDGFLYVGFGEDGQYDPAQSLKTFKGKMVRLDVDKPEGDKHYGIPPTNPFANSTDATVLKEIWAYGLRNPWRWSFDAVTGDLWLADVGETTREEINLVTTGNNLGWPQTEGMDCSSYYPSCNKSAYVAPVKDFGRDTSACIIGGHIFRGDPASEAYGSYVFADHQLRQIYVMKLDKGKNAGVQRIGNTADYISALGADAQGNLYVVTWYNGIIYKIDDPAFRGKQDPVRTRRPSIGPPLLPGRGGTALNPDFAGDGAGVRLAGLDGRSVANLAPGTRLRSLPAGTYIATSGGRRTFFVNLP